jgi:ATP-grasp domain
MNIVFLSPHFPPNFYLFCQRLRAQGVTVLGLDAQPYDALRPELRAALSEYYYVSDLHNYDELLRALGYFTHRYGKLDRIDSLNEYWLESEARLRSDFNIPGPKLADMPAVKRKSEMKRYFVEAGIPVARGLLSDDPAEIAAFAEQVGLPLVAKPDSGVGANETFKLTSQAELAAFLARRLSGYFIEEFVRGTIVTFDGLANRAGEPVFCTSMEYSQGVMDVVNNDDDVYYFTQRSIPADLERAGRAMLAAFEVRERFFHFEFFRTPEGRLVALEVNMRPPGGLSLDMFNYAGNIDLYGAWAALLVHGHMPSIGPAPYSVCYAGRKYGKPYAHSHDDVLRCYAHLIVHHQPMAQVFRRAMGDYGYLLRSPDSAEGVEAARYIQALI